MFALLERLRDGYGSFRGYANDIGLSDAVIDRLEGWPSRTGFRLTGRGTAGSRPGSPRTARISVSIGRPIGKLSATRAGRASAVRFSCRLPALGLSERPWEIPSWGVDGSGSVITISDVSRTPSNGVWRQAMTAHWIVPRRAARSECVDFASPALEPGPILRRSVLSIGRPGCATRDRLICSRR